jgi:hypothetical protein
MLEPYAVKVACTVLKGLGVGNDLRLLNKGTKSGCNGFVDVTTNGQMIFGLQVASKVFTIICDVELGKPYMIPLKKGVGAP